MDFLKRRRKFLILLSVVIITGFIIYILCFFENRDIKLSPVGQKMNRQQLFHDLKLLGLQEYSNERIRILTNGSEPDATVTDVVGADDQKNIVIEAIIKNKRYGDFSKPLEVRAAMRILLFLENRSVSFSIAGTKVIIEKKGLFGGSGDMNVLVSNQDVDKLFLKVANKKLNEEKLISELTDLWISEHHYKRVQGKW